MVGAARASGCSRAALGIQEFFIEPARVFGLVHVSVVITRDEINGCGYMRVSAQGASLIAVHSSGAKRERKTWRVVNECKSDSLHSEVVYVPSFIKRRASFIVKNEARGELLFHSSGGCIQLKKSRKCKSMGGVVCRRDATWKELWYLLPRDVVPNLMSQGEDKSFSTGEAH